MPDRDRLRGSIVSHLNHNAPDKKEKPPPREEKALSAPGSRKKQLPGAEKALSAPGSKGNRLPGAGKGAGAPGGDGFRCQVDEVGFQGVYLVHRVWLRRASGAGAVDLVQAFKVDLVH